MTVSSAFAFIGHLKAKDLAIPHPKLLPGTADLPEALKLGHVGAALAVSSSTSSDDVILILIRILSDLLLHLIASHPATR